MRPIPSHSRRRGFTLIELIVVMTIIVVLASLTLGVVSKGFGWVKQKNTEQTMTKVITRLQRVIDRLYKEADDWPAHTESFILEQASGSIERARIIKIMYLYKWNFPNSYAEAFHNVQESRQLYDNRMVNTAVPSDPNNFPGYPPARALLNKLRQGNPTILDPFTLPYMPFPHCIPANPVYSFWAAGTPSVAAMASELPRQSAACMMAAFTTANGTPDEFTNNEVVTGVVDQNPFLTDAWGTPLLFLRLGNFANSRHRMGTGGADRAAWSVGMVKPGAIADLDFAPLEYVLNPATNLPPSAGTITSFYYTQLQRRADSAYPTLNTTDPFDPTGLLKVNQQWRANAIILNVYNPTPVNPAYFAWMDYRFGLTPWLAIPGPAPVSHALMYRRNFGYTPESAPTSLGIPNQAYTPMLILSAGGDRIFNQWDDNLDSYRLQIYTGGQQ